jgi:predicted ribosomally synthesized peptide with nif11-like leader
MSIKAVSEFLEKVGEDAKLQDEVVKVIESGTENNKIVEIGAKYGYQFTLEEIMQELEKIQQAAIEFDELGENELEAVAGGWIELPKNPRFKNTWLPKERRNRE